MCKAVILLALLGAAPAHAQSTGSAAPGETVVLSPFNVSASNGYVASQAMTATGIGALIRDVPVTINVVTDQYIKDRNFNAAYELLDSIPGVTGRRRGGVVVTRGFQTLVQQDSISGDTQMITEAIAQVEVIKGASSVFHGIVRPGGVINYVMKKPQYKADHELALSAGTDNYTKAAFTSTGPLLPGKVAYLIVASDQEQNHTSIDFAGQDLGYVRGALDIRPVPALQALISIEHVDYDNRPGTSPNTTHPAFLAAIARGEVPPNTQLRNWVFANIGPNEPPSAIDANPYIMPPLPFNPLNQEQRGRTINTRRADFFLTPSDHWSFRAVAAETETEADTLELNIFRMFGSFTSYPNTRPFWRRDWSKSRQYEAEGVAKFDFAGADHRLLVGFERDERESISVTLQSAPFTYTPVTDGPLNLRDRVLAANPSEFTGRFNGPAARQNVESYYLAEQAAFMEGKLRLLGGLRHTSVESIATNGTRLEVSKVTKQIGAMYAVTPSLSLFGSYGDTIDPRFNVDVLTGRVVDTPTGDGIEAGLKFESRDRAHSATLSYYQIEFQNEPIRDFAREAALARTPIFFDSGQFSRGEGVELETFFSGLNGRLSGTFNYAYSWEATTTRQPADPNQVGVRLEGTPEHKAVFWGRYDFARSGRLPGFYVGFGVQYRTEVRIHPSWEILLQSPKLFLVDALIGYRGSVGETRYDASINLSNLTDKLYYGNSLTYSDQFRAVANVRFRF